MNRLLFSIPLVILMMRSGQATPQTDIDTQVPLAMKLLQAWEDENPERKKRYLHVIYWTPSDRTPATDYDVRLHRMLEHIQGFYAKEMERLGFGPRTIQLQHDDQGKLVIHLVKGKEPYANYNVQSGNKIRGECLPTIKAAGIDPQNETLVMFCNMADWDAEKRRLTHRSPYYAGGSARGGNAWQLDSPILDTLHLTNKGDTLRDGQYGNISLGKHNSIFIGGIAHELGHALGVPHNKERPDERNIFGTALMGAGNRSYGNELREEGKGSFLTLAHALRLASHPQFSGSVKQLSTKPRMTLSEQMIKPKGKGFVFSGKVSSDIPVYAIVAYTDPKGGGDYNATTASAIPDADGRFSLHCNPLVPGKDAELKLVACFVNGAASANAGPWSPNTFHYTVARDGTPNIAPLQQRLTLKPLVEAVNRRDRDAVKQAIAFTRKHAADESTTQMAKRLLHTLNPHPQEQRPDEVPAKETKVALADLTPDTEKVGWKKPIRGRVPDAGALFESNNRLFESGIYAHAPAEHIFTLGKKWKMLTGTCGIFDNHPGSVAFIIKGDDKEIFHSDVIRNGALETYSVSLEGVEKLELIVTPGGDGASNDWGLWLEPMLTR